MSRPLRHNWAGRVLVLTAICSSAALGGNHVALGEDTTWLVIDVATRRYQRVQLPRQMSAEDLAVSRDGRALAFTARTLESRVPLLFIWDRDPSHLPRSIGDARGWHSDPQFSPDARWVYFAHNPEANGPPMSHGMRAYAQIYRVRVDGTGIEALTAEDGCHFSPSFSGSGVLNFVHTLCHRFDRSLVEYDIRHSTVISERPLGAAPDEIALSADGSKLVGSAPGVDSLRVAQYDLRTHRWKQLETYRVTSQKKARARFGAKPDELFFYRDGAVWSSQKGKSQVFANLKGAVP